MLSFFRTKSSDASVDKITEGTNEIALNIDKAAIDIANCNADDSMSNVQSTCSNELLTSLGYQNEDKLKQTIYGKFIVQLNMHSNNCTHEFVFRYIKNNPWSGKTINSWGSQSCLWRRYFYTATNKW